MTGRPWRKTIRPCEVCGTPTASRLGVCAANRACINERRRRERTDQKGAPSVYAIWFPVPQVLKTGFTTDTADFIPVSVAANRVRKRGWASAGAQLLWRMPGDLRTEAWMQVTLAFRWQGAYAQVNLKICEWFDVTGIPEPEIIAVLDEVYKAVPVDLVAPS